MQGVVGARQRRLQRNSIQTTLVTHLLFVEALPHALGPPCSRRCVSGRECGCRSFNADGPTCERDSKTTIGNSEQSKFGMILQEFTTNEHVKSAQSSVASLGNSRTKRGKVVRAIDQCHWHARNTQSACARCQDESGNAQVDVEAKGDVGSVAADVVVGIHASAAERRGERNT